MRKIILRNADGIYKKIICTAIAITTCFGQSHAIERFDVIVDEIISNNTELKSQTKAIQAQRMEDADANALADPEVELSRVWGRHGIGNKLQLDISQEFEWPSVYGLRNRAADTQAAAAAMAYEAAVLDLKAEAKSLLMELVFVRQQITAIKNLRENFRNLSKAIDMGVRGGELTVLDQRKMQMEEFEIDKQISDLLAQEQNVIGKLQAMTTSTLDLSEITAYPVQQVLSKTEYLSMVTSDPMISSQTFNIQQEELNAKIAVQSKFPTISLGYQHQAEMGDRFNGFTVGVNIPVFQGRKAKRVALDRMEAASLSQEMLVAQRSAEVESTYNDLEIQKTQINIFNQVFGDNKYLDLLLKAYKGGEISVIEYLSELHYYHQVTLAHLESEYNYNLDLANLNRYN